MVTDVLVIDGQGGKMGCAVIESLKKKCPGLFILAAGTNGAATAAMLKAGADAGATGENPVVVNAPKARCIAGPVGIIAADSLYGEITPRMAEAVGASDAHKFLIPVSKCGITVVGVKEQPPGVFFEETAELIFDYLHK